MLCRSIPVMLAAATVANADFTFYDEMPLHAGGPNLHGITTDGNLWFIAHPLTATYDMYNSTFNYQATFEAEGALHIRGITWDGDRDHLFVAEFQGVVREVEQDGTLVNEFDLPAGNVNNIAINPKDKTLWIATFDQGILHVDRDGNLLGSFQTPGRKWTGLAVDYQADKLILLETGDTVHEYEFDGEHTRALWRPIRSSATARVSITTPRPPCST